MSLKEKLQSGDSVIVRTCDKSKPPCIVTSGIDERKDEGVPLSTSHCGCVRNREEVEKISHILK